MDFPREELLDKYVRLREQIIDPYVPDFSTKNDTVRYVRFNDYWRGMNPYSKFLLPRLTNSKNTFPKVPSRKIAKNADPANYVTLNYDGEGKLKMARLGKINDSEIANLYISDQLTVSYTIYGDPNSLPSYEANEFEWYEFDDLGRIVSAEEFRFKGDPTDDVVINCEYYEYDGDMLSHAWCFKEFNKYPMQMRLNLIQSMMPDRIFNPDQLEYSFRRGDEGLDITCDHFYRKSQTITNEFHASEKTLLHLAENGFRLV